MINKNDLFPIGIGTWGVGGFVEKDSGVDVKKQKEAITYMFNRGMNLVNLQIIPHLNSPHFTKIREEYLEEASKDLTEAVYAIDDDTAVMIDGDKIEVVSVGKWRKFN